MGRATTSWLDSLLERRTRHERSSALRGGRMCPLFRSKGSGSPFTPVCCCFACGGDFVCHPRGQQMPLFTPKGHHVCSKLKSIDSPTSFFDPTRFSRRSHVGHGFPGFRIDCHAHGCAEVVVSSRRGHHPSIAPLPDQRQGNFHSLTRCSIASDVGLQRRRHAAQA